MFNDPDTIEKQMGVRVEEMSPEQLATYLQSYQQTRSINLPMDGIKERSVFRGLQKTYGQEGAGRIVKWATHHHKGTFRNQSIGYFDFAKSRKWFTDKLYVEMQEHLRKEAPSFAPGVRVTDF